MISNATSGPFSNNLGTSPLASSPSIEQQATTASKAQRGRLDADGTMSLVLKLRIGQNGEKLKQIQKDADGFRTDMVNRGATMGPSGWIANILQQPTPKHAVDKETKDQS